jgi:hypothetical protein
MMKTTDNPYDRIKLAAGELRQIYREIDTNREIWHNKVKKTVKKTFKSVIKESKLHLLIRKYDEVRNLESIQLTFGILNSGLLIEPSKMRSTELSMVLLKRGGLLAYSLLASGKVSVVIQYPYIEDVMGSPQNIKEIGTYSPAEITEELILEHVENFIQEIIKWEKEEKKLIGFHLKNISK